MRVGFLLALLLLSGYYTYVAFIELSFLTVSGRLGPGFFPRLIGVGLILSCLFSLPQDLRRETEGEARSPFWPTVLVIAGLSGGMVLLFMLIGGTLAMVVFLLATLTVLNRGHLFQNVLIAVLLPLGIYLLFDTWLNASMPEGLLPLRI